MKFHMLDGQRKRNHSTVLHKLQMGGGGGCFGLCAYECNNV